MEQGRFAIKAGLFFGDLEMVMIPPEFTAQYLHANMRQTAKIHIDGLRRPIWKVWVFKFEDNLYFADGWRDFVQQTMPSRCAWMLLTFQYKGGMNFYVCRYKPDGDFIYQMPQCEVPVGTPPTLTESDPSCCVELFPSTRRARSQNIPTRFADKIKHFRPTRVNMRVEGYIHKAVDVLIKYHEDTLQFTEGWLTFVRVNELYKYNWAVFKLSGRGEVVVHAYNVPNPTNDAEGEWVVVDHIMLSDSKAEPVTAEEPMDSSEDEMELGDEEDEEQYPEHIMLSDSEAEPVTSEEPMDSSEYEMELGDQEDEGQYPPWFECKAQKHTAQVPTSWARLNIPRGGYFMSKLYFNRNDEGADVWVVKSNETVKFSAGFTDFMKENGIKLGNSLRFIKIGDKEFDVFKL